MNKNYILGLDLGANSIGWALLNCDDNNEPKEILKTGVRVFEAGIENFGLDKEKSRGQKRRDSRQQRRQKDRHRRRLNSLFLFLQKSSLLPIYIEFQKLKDISEIKLNTFIQLDKELQNKWGQKLNLQNEEKLSIQSKVHHNLPYLLRAKGLDEKLDMFEIGRVFYHIAQRRGWDKSNKVIINDEEKKKYENKIEKGASELQAKINESKARTLGEYFLNYNPFDNSNLSNKIRGHYTLREQYKKEFNLIWDKQKSSYSQLTDDLKNEIFNIIFHQRPLKSWEHLIGNCQFEKDKKREPRGSLIAQYFKLLKKLSDTRITENGIKRELTNNQKEKLIKILQYKKESLSLSEIKEILDLSKNVKINFESSNEKKIYGNKTYLHFKETLKDKWEKLKEAEKEKLVNEVLKHKNVGEVFNINYAKDIGLLDGDISKLLESKFLSKLENQYLNYSDIALKKLIPNIEQGISEQAAIKELYGEKEIPVHNELPPVNEFNEYLPNPAVKRALTELRRVINHIVKNYGKPSIIRIELARDLKKSKKEREAIQSQNQENEKKRKTAAEEFKKKNTREATGIEKEKVILAEECQWRCPYTNEQISMTTLDNFDIAHIIPFSRCLDNSFLDKTLCNRNFNVNIQKNQTPFELFCNDHKTYTEVLNRVSNFTGYRRNEIDIAKVLSQNEKYLDKIKKINPKLYRFMISDIKSLYGEDFSARQLNDTRYISKEAIGYLGLLYGIDNKGIKDGKKIIQISMGQATSHLRNIWNLNKVLNDGDKKERNDHRHHSVDAIVTALTTPATLKQLSNSSKSAKSKGLKKLYEQAEIPYNIKFEDIKKSIDKIMVSHRVSHKIAGSLHEDTLYSREILNPLDNKKYVHIKKSLINLTPEFFRNIVDEKAKESISKKMQALGKDINNKKDFKIFNKIENLPFIISNDEKKKIPIKKVRCRVPDKVFPIGNGLRTRNVLTGSNSHIEVFETIEKGKKKWYGRLVTVFEAYQRKNKKEPIINKNPNNTKDKFKFSLFKGDCVLVQDKYYIVRKFSVYGNSPRLNFSMINKSSLKDGYDLDKMLNPLMQLGCQKVIITPFGEIRNANN